MNERIAALPSRDWREGAEVLVQKWTARCKTPVGTQEVRAIQAAVLEEAERLGGVYVVGRVGCGKSLMAALLAEAFGATRPLLLLPGSMVGPTKAEHRKIKLHWKFPSTLRIQSYEFISNPKQGKDVNGQYWLDRNYCDALIVDESHSLKDIKKSSCARRVYRYLAAHPEVKFAAMTGTPTSDGDLMHYVHLLIMALRARAPVPLKESEQLAWSRAMDGTGDTRKLMGATSMGQATRKFTSLLKGTPGVVVSEDTFDDVPLTVTVKCHDSSEALRPHFQALRDYWQAPDGWTFDTEAGAMGVAALARQMGNGFCYMSDPRPPEWYLAKRKAWTGYCNNEVDSDRADSPGEIKAGIRAGTSFMGGATALREWEAAEASFPMQRVQQWLCGDALKYAKAWARPHGLIWVSHIEVGEMLERCTGLRFYNGQPDRNIEEQDGSECCIVSTQANSTGKNLQYAFRHNLLMAPPANGGMIEQLLGRTHREGQVHPVTAEFYCSCLEHFSAVKTSIEDARTITGTLSPQKMNSIQIARVSKQDHPAWQKPQRLD